MGACACKSKRSTVKRSKRPKSWVVGYGPNMTRQKEFKTKKAAIAYAKKHGGMLFPQFY